MKKIITCLAAVLCISTASYGQYYYNANVGAGQNPGGLNVDSEFPSGAGLPAGWISILGPSVTTPAWSTNQSIPFSFNFNANPVTQYKVSSTGVLTFNTAATSVPGSTPAALPAASIPDNSVCIWGIEASGGNDRVMTKTFGTAPNRQHWVFFTSHSLNGGWSYWSIVMEESTDKIFIVDQRHSGTTGGVAMGIQINSTTAHSVAGSPAVMPQAGTDATPIDNSFYEFIQGTRPADNIELVNLNMNDLISTGAVASISGTLVNYGTDTLKSYDLSWTVDGGTTVNTQTISALVAPSASANFSHPTTWTPARGEYDITVYSSSPNGNVDPITNNDTLKKSVTVRTFVTRNVLLEEFTTAPCQFCPDGAVIVEQVLANYPNVIGVGEHACFSTDAMTIPEASTYCSAFGSGAPTACIDRILFPGETNVAIGRGSWAARVAERDVLGAFVDVNLRGSYNNMTKQASVNVNSTFVDSVDTGDLRVSLFIVEDSVTGTGPGYNQVNAFNAVTGHPYAGAGNPIVGFVHRHVLRDVYPANDAWGDNTIIPTSPVLNTTYTANYTFTLNNAWKEKDMYVVGFVSYFNAAAGQREVLNAVQVKLTDIVTGINEVNQNASILSIYPNPTNSLTNIEMDLRNSNRVELSVYDMTGKEMLSQNYGVMTQGKQRIQLELDNLSNGFYFINIKVGDQMITKKVSVVKN